MTYNCVGVQNDEAFVGNGASTGKMETNGETVPKAMSRGHVIAIWGAIGTMLSTQVIPALVDYLTDKPSSAQVQAMIAGQTEKLTQGHNKVIEAVKQLRDALEKLREDCEEADSTATKLEGRTDVMRDVISVCCAHREVRERLEQPDVSAPPRPTIVHKAAKALGDLLGPGKEERSAPAVEALAPLPDFTQQQLQVQEPRP